MASPLPVSPKIRFGAFELDAAAGKLFKHGIPIKLQPQPLRVLQLLTGCPGQAVTREEIQRCLWGDSTFVDFERGINFSINQIRGVLSDDAEKPRYVETLPRIGYRFIAAVTSDGLTEAAITPTTSVSSGRLYKWPEESKTLTATSSEGKALSGPQIPVAPWHSYVLTRAIVGLLVLVTVGFGAHRFLSRSPDFDLRNAQMTRLTDNGRVQGAAISPDGRYVVYARGEWDEEVFGCVRCPRGATCSFCRSERVSMA